MKPGFLFCIFKDIVFFPCFLVAMLRCHFALRASFMVIGGCVMRLSLFTVIFHFYLFIFIFSFNNLPVSAFGGADAFDFAFLFKAFKITINCHPGHTQYFT